MRASACACVRATHDTNRYKRCLAKSRKEYFVRFTFWRRCAPLSLLPSFNSIPIYSCAPSLPPSPFATHPISYSFCLTTNFLTFLLLPSQPFFSTPRLFVSISPPTFLFAPSSPLLSSVKFSSAPVRVRKIREGVKTGENGGRNRTVVEKKMERGRKRLKG